MFPFPHLGHVSSLLDWSLRPHRVQRSSKITAGKLPYLLLGCPRGFASRLASRNSFQYGFMDSYRACADIFVAQIPSWEVTLPQECSIRLKPPTSENEIEVMTAVSNLANTVIANTASRALAK